MSNEPMDTGRDATQDAPRVLDDREIGVADDGRAEETQRYRDDMTDDEREAAFQEQAEDVEGRLDDLRSGNQTRDRADGVGNDELRGAGDLDDDDLRSADRPAPGQQGNFPG